MTEADLKDIEAILGQTAPLKKHKAQALLDEVRRLRAVMVDALDCASLADDGYAARRVLREGLK